MKTLNKNSPLKSKFRRDNHLKFFIFADDLKKSNQIDKSSSKSVYRKSQIKLGYGIKTDKSLRFFSLQKDYCNGLDLCQVTDSQIFGFRRNQPFLIDLVQKVSQR